MDGMVALALAYSAVWGLLGAYLLKLFLDLRKVERDMALLERMTDEKDEGH